MRHNRGRPHNSTYSDPSHQQPTRMRKPSRPLTGSDRASTDEKSSRRCHTPLTFTVSRRMSESKIARSDIRDIRRPREANRETTGRDDHGSRSRVITTGDDRESRSRVTVTEVDHGSRDDRTIRRSRATVSGRSETVDRSSVIGHQPPAIENSAIGNSAVKVLATAPATVQTIAGRS